MDELGCGSILTTKGKGATEGMTTLIPQTADGCAADIFTPNHSLDRLVIDTLSVGVTVYDENDRIVICNERMRDLCPEMADVFTVGHQLKEVLRAAHLRDQFVIPAKALELVESVGLEKALDIETKSFRKGRDEQIREHEMVDGRWIRLVTRVLDNAHLVGVAVDITEIKHRERELKEIQRRQEYIVDAIPAGVLVYDRDNNFILANKELRDSLPEIKPAMAPGKPLRDALELGHDAGYFEISTNAELDALYHTDRERWLDLFEKGYESKHSTTERLNHDGRWLKVINTRTDDGTLVGIRLDITEMKLREAEVEAANTRLQDAIDALKDGFVIWDSEDRVVVANDAFCNQIPDQLELRDGATHRELLEEHAASGRAKCDPGREAEWVEEMLTRRTAELGSEIVFETVDGRWIMRRDQLTAAGDRVGIRTDITDVKRNELDLIAARNQTDRLLTDFRTTIDTLEMGVLLVDRNLQTEILNTAFFDIWKIDPAAVTEGCHFRELMDINRNKGIYHVSDDDWEQYVDSCCRKIQGGDIPPKEMVRADGVILIYSVTSLSDGKRLVTYYDITEQKQREIALAAAEKKAVLADRAKSEFLANMSHEIRTPMNGVLGMAELLAKSELDPKQRTFTEIIVKSGNALLTIINDILDFSKIDAGQLELNPAAFELAEAIEDVATLISARAKEKDLELIVRIQPDLPGKLVGDVGRIRQIITNLMGNAVKFTESGHVLVEVTGSSGDFSTRLKIAVTDTGIGIQEDKLESVFEKFSQVDGSSTRLHEGTGLGLTISSRLIELMAGEIGVESKPGEGSTFWFTVELENCTDCRSKPVAPVDVSGARIVIIDDNPVNRAILMEQMIGWSFDACAVESGQIGLMVLEAAAQRGKGADCIILDYQMPGMSGFSVAEAIRKHPKLFNTPIVMLTSVDQALTCALNRELAINAHLVKPARSSQLFETIVSTIQSKRGSRVDLPDARQTVVPVITAPEESAMTERRAKDVEILVAEDNEVNQLVFSQILAETGLTFEIVDNGRLAVEAAGKLKPRLILMDVSMPELNGLEAASAIRNQELATGDRIPIVGVTAHALKGDRELCLESGMDDYMSKPISPDALHSMIDKWLGEPRSLGKISA